MVNKAVVGILVLVVVTSLGVGVLIGTQLSGSDGDTGSPTETPSNGDTDDDGASEEQGTATNGTNGTETSANGTEQETATPAQTPIPPAAFSEAKIEREMVATINEGRSERGLTTYETGTRTWERLRTMVRIHSSAMADKRKAVFEINGNTTAGRYKEAALFDRCKYQEPDGGYIVTPDNAFQAVGGTTAGKTFTDDGETHRYTNESVIADVIVEEWFSSTTYQRPLLNEVTEMIAVGVSITEDGKVYAAAAICA